MTRDWGAIFWPETPRSRYGVVSPAEGNTIASRALFVASLAAAASRVTLPGQVGSNVAWLVFPVALLLVSWWGRAYYRHRGARHPGRVLVVEDDPQTLGLMERTLRRRGWDVDGARSLAEAKEMLARDPSWVILDVRLPDGSGLDLFRYLRPGPTRPRTIVVTGSHDPAVQAEIGTARPTLIIYKPVDVAGLLDALGDP